MGAITIIDPRDPPYGAVGGGANDTAAFVAALAASQAQGIPLYLPPGAWAMDEIQFDPTKPINVFGAGSTLTTINKFTADGNPILNVPAIGGGTFNFQARMRGFMLNGKGATITQACLMLNGVARASFHDIYYQNANSGVIQTNCVKNTYDEDCIIQSCQNGFVNNISELTTWRGGIYWCPGWAFYNTGCTETILDGADIERNGAAGGGGAIYADPTNVSIRVRDSWIEANNGPIAVEITGGLYDEIGGQCCSNTGTYDYYFSVGVAMRLRMKQFQSPRTPISIWATGLKPDSVIERCVGITAANCQIDANTTFV